MHKKFFILSLLLLISGGIVFFVLQPTSKQQQAKALNALKVGNFEAAEQILKASSLSEEAKLLYFGYVEQLRGCLAKSNHLLETGYLVAKKKNQIALMREILLMQATNAYYEKNEERFFSYLETLRLLPHTNIDVEPDCIFFDGLYAYLNQDYAEALQLWNHDALHASHPWLALSFEKFFPHPWKKIHLAHCLIEIGEIAKGREILEKENHLVTCHQEYQQLATLFLGLSYLKEAPRIPLEQRSSTYAMARFYFEHAQVEETFRHEKARVINYLEEEASKLLLIDPEKCLWGLECVHILQQWNAQQAVCRLAEEVVKKSVKLTALTAIDFCYKVNEEFADTPFYLYLTENLLLTLKQTLKKGENEELFVLWNLIAILVKQPQSEIKELASLNAEEIFETVKKDNCQLTRTQDYLSFWEKLGRNQTDRLQLARELIYQSKLFWNSEEQEQKGLKLMTLGLQLSNHHPAIEKEITCFLTTLYRRAESNNMIRRLTLISHAMKHFNINQQDLVTKTTLANHLADAEYLYNTHNYPSAKLHASWVLKLNPDNDVARRLVGLCSFHLGEYNRAIVYLRALKNLDEDACKALMLCQALSMEEQAKQICKTDILENFEDVVD